MLIIQYTMDYFRSVFQGSDTKRSKKDVSGVRSIHVDIKDWKNNTIVNSRKMNDVINDSTLFQSAINKNKMCCKFTDNSIPDMQLIQTSNKGFHDSLYMAYAQHLTFGLRPDHVWIMIMQSLSKHVELNAEKFRHLFTESKKKEKLTVEIEHNQFIQFIDSMAKQLGSKIKFDPVLDFTTSTPITIAVSKVSLMSMCKSFFDYACSTECGVPDINVYGTVEDWNKIIEKLSVLGQLFDLKDWTNTLIQVVTKIRDCDANDKEFWSEIYKYNGGSGGPFVSGWIMAFYLYTKGDNPRRFNWRFGMTEEDFGYDGGYSTSEFPSEILEVPYVYDDNGNIRNMNLYAGMAGVVQNKVTGEVQPCVGWCSVDVL